MLRLDIRVHKTIEYTKSLLLRGGKILCFAILPHPFHTLCKLYNDPHNAMHEHCTVLWRP